MPPVASMPEEMEEGAEQQKDIRESAQDMGAMLREQEETGDAEKTQ